MRKRIHARWVRIGWILLTLILAQCSTSSRPRTWVAGWQDAIPMTTPRTGAKAVAVHDYVYVLGGGEGIPGPGTVHRSVEYARIRPDGTLETWKTTSPMNTPRIFLATARAGDVIYALGGEYFPEGQMHLLNSVEWARVGTDGPLGPWHDASTMLTPRRSPTAAVVGDYLYAMGGYNGVFLRTVERARILADGELGPWEWVPQSLTTSRYIHGGAAVGNRIYVVGGHLMESGRGSSAAEWATVGPDGQINSWKPTSALLQSRFLAGSTAAGESIFVIGGYDGRYLSSVEQARIQPDGNLGPWSQTTPLPTPREGPAVAAHGNRIYVMGGSNSGVFLRTAEWAEVDSDGHLGYWHSEQ
ncbi:MAG: hypothetical protein HY283_00040 [Nitrospirae bacterium]|nr:hypothetical protein [Nitrospirota bacterium]